MSLRTVAGDTSTPGAEATWLDPTGWAFWMYSSTTARRMVALRSSSNGLGLIGVWGWHSMSTRCLAASPSLGAGQRLSPGDRSRFVAARAVAGASRSLSRCLRMMSTRSPGGGSRRRPAPTAARRGRLAASRAAFCRCRPASAASTPCSAMKSAHSTSASTISSSGTTATFWPLHEQVALVAPGDAEVGVEGLARTVHHTPHHGHLEWHLAVFEAQVGTLRPGRSRRSRRGRTRGRRLARGPCARATPSPRAAGDRPVPPQPGLR